VAVAALNSISDNGAIDDLNLILKLAAVKMEGCVIAKKEEIICILCMPVSRKGKH
jgi:hypothetical protein